MGIEFNESQINEDGTQTSRLNTRNKAVEPAPVPAPAPPGPPVQKSRSIRRRSSIEEV